MESKHDLEHSSNLKKGARLDNLHPFSLNYSVCFGVVSICVQIPNSITFTCSHESILTAHNVIHFPPWKSIKSHMTFWFILPISFCHWGKIISIKKIPTGCYGLELHLCIIWSEMYIQYSRCTCHLKPTPCLHHLHPVSFFPILCQAPTL